MRIAVLFLTIALAGCAENQFGTSLFYFEPYGLENRTCVELKMSAMGTKARVEELRRLRDKAAIGAGGSAIGTATYGPDYSRAEFDQQAYERAYARKNCKDDPPPPPPGAKPPGTPAAAAPPNATTVVPR